MITLPFTLRAARPAVCVSERWERRNPSLSASRIATVSYTHLDVYKRQNLVYAVKIAVKNDGALKIGMYGGVKLKNED